MAWHAKPDFMLCFRVLDFVDCVCYCFVCVFGGLFRLFGFVYVVLFIVAVMSLVYLGFEFAWITWVLIVLWCWELVR